MRILLPLSVLLLVLSGNALAGSGYDRCIKEQDALKKKEAGACSGFSYLLNPSACFATQKALREYTATDKCNKIGSAENADSGVLPVVPAKQAVSGGNGGGGNPAVEVKKPEPVAPHPESTCEQLKDENVRLKAEINHLTTENEQLRKTGK
ncbi:hypothetical protein F6V30_09445 [Oryzomonas sagensis]|uniref:Uncharacterized protein n=1 Tax=Oryzomonas sagensis TaxID=2603857 RepID=A0ABQ6TPT4_9BACT|nr:bZIP transcription factor [Oryzomonas sagensis]KAB0670367.1 hypothetical protein F6V30_09445 [Oryzomonas sagensis]